MPSQMPSQEQPIQSIVAANVRTARDAADLTQRELGQALDVDPMYVSRWERGVVMPSPQNLVRLATALGRDLAWFYTDHERKAA